METNAMNAPGMSGTETLVKDLSLPIFEAKVWMKLLGVVMIAYGVILVFTIFGIIFCWLPIWLGVLLFKAAGFAESARMTGEKLQLVESLRRIRTFFVINGVMMLISLAAMLLMFLMGGAAFLSGLGNM